MPSKSFTPTAADTFSLAELKILQNSKLTLKDKRYYESFASDADSNNLTQYNFNEESYIISADGNTADTLNYKKGFDLSAAWQSAIVSSSGELVTDGPLKLNDGSYILKLGAGGIYKSINLLSGYTLAYTSPITLYNFIYDSTNNRLFLPNSNNNSGQVLYSDDYGVSWTSVTVTGMNRVYQLNYVSPGVILASGNNTNSDPAIAQSSDGGLTWEVLCNTTGFSSQIITGDYVDGEYFAYITGIAPWVLYTTGNMTTLLRNSNISGPIGKLYTSNTWSYIYAKTSTTGKAQVWVGATMGGIFFKTLDVSGTYMKAFYKISDTQFIAYLSNGNVYYSEDSAVTFTEISAHAASLITASNFIEMQVRPQDIGSQDYDFNVMLAEAQADGVWGGKAMSINDKTYGSGTSEILAPSGDCEIEIVMNNVTGDHHIFESSGSYARVDSNTFSFYNNYSTGNETVSAVIDVGQTHIRIQYDYSNLEMKLYIDNVLQDTQSINSADLDIAHNAASFISKSGYDDTEISMFKIYGNIRSTLLINYDFTQATDYLTSAFSVFKESEAVELDGYKIDSFTSTQVDDAGSVKYLLYEVDEGKYYYCNPSNSYAVTEVTSGNIDAAHSNTAAEMDTYADDIINAGHTNIVPVLVFTSDGSQRPTFTSLEIAYSERNTAPSLNAGDNKFTFVNETIAPFSDAIMSDTEDNLSYATATIEGNTTRIDKGAYATLQLAVRAFTHLFSNENTTNPYVECTLTVYDDGVPALSAQDVCSVVVAPEQIVNNFYAIPLKVKLQDTKLTVKVQN